MTRGHSERLERKPYLQRCTLRDRCSVTTKPLRKGREGADGRRGGLVLVRKNQKQTLRELLVGGPP